MASRLAAIHKAVRPALKARMIIGGPSGAGKTRSGLWCATVLAEGEPILVVDTERESALTYADDFSFDHLPWYPPYDPRTLAETIREAGDTYAVIMVDSLSHFWRKEGGTLDIAGGKFTGWKDASPAQEQMVDAILATPAHVILCVRSKVEYVQEAHDGKQVVRKLGMALQQDNDLEFEVNVAVELSMDHTISISKSRTTVLPVGSTYPGHRVEAMATTYLEWLKGGEPPADLVVVNALKERMNALPESMRKEVKAQWMAQLGKPETLRESQVGAAEALVAGYEAKLAELGDPQPQVETPAEQPAVVPLPEPTVQVDPVSRAVEWVKSLSADVVRYELEVRNLGSAGKDVLLRRRLAEAAAQEYQIPVDQEALPI